MSIVARITRYRSTVVEPWNQQYQITPTNFGVISSTYLSGRRIGDTLELWGTFRAGTTAAAQGQLVFPSGIKLDLTKITSIANAQALGYLWPLGPGAGPTGIGATLPIVWDGSSTDRLYVTDMFTSGVFHSGRTIDGAVAANSRVSYDFAIPVAGWNSWQRA